MPSRSMTRPFLALDVGPILESVRHNGSGYNPSKRLRPDRTIGELLTRIYLGFNIEADFRSISPAAIGVGMTASRTGAVIVRVECHKIE